MSKAVEIVAGIALIAAGPLGWAAFSATGALVAGSLGAALGGMATSLGASLLLSAAAQTFGPKPNRASPTASGIDVAYSGTLEPRRIIYGKLKVSGMNAIPPMTSGTNNDYFHQVLVVAGHPVNAIGDVYFGQVRIPSANIAAVSGASGDGLVSGIPAPPSGQVNGQPYNNLAWIRRYTGSQTAADYILANSFTVWDLNHKGLELAYLALQFKFDQNAYSGGVPTVTAIVQGKKLYDPRLDTTNGGSGSQRYTDPTTWTYSTNPALCLRDYLTSPLGLGEAQTRIDDVLVSAAANKCDENVQAPLPVLVGLTTWTSGSNVVNGTNTAFQAVIGAGYYVKAPNGTMYLISTVDSDTQLHLSVSYPGTSASGQITQWSSVNSTWQAQARFTCNTAIDSTARYEDNITMLAGAMMGHCLYSGGKWRMYAGGWSGSAFTLAEGDLVGTVTIQCSTPRKDLYNSVRGNFLDPQQNYQPAEFPAIIDSAFVTEDGGETIYLETSFPCCSDSYEAQRNAIVMVEQSRNRHIVTAQFGMSAFGVKPWETGTATLSEVGWIAQTVRCLSWKFLPQGVVELALQEAYAADWTDPLLSDYSVNGVNVGPLPLHYLPYPPTALTATSVPGAIDFVVVLPDQVLPGTTIELWEYTASTPFSSASLVGLFTGNKYTLYKNDTITRYYWVRTRGPSNSLVQVSPTYPTTTGVAGAAGPPGFAVWNVLGNALIGPDDTVSKVGGSSAWDSGVISVNGYLTCHITGKTDWRYASKNMMIGLTRTPGGGASYTNIDYAIYLTNGTVQVYESGSLIGTYGTYTGQDTFTVLYNGTATGITYLKNETPILYNRGAAGLTLYGQVALYEPDATVRSVRFGPTQNTTLNDTGDLTGEASSQMVSSILGSRATFYYANSTTSLTNQATGAGVTISCRGDSPVAIDGYIQFQYGVFNNGTTWQVKFQVRNVTTGNLIGTDFILNQGGVTWALNNWYPANATLTAVDPSPAAGNNDYYIVISSMTSNATGVSANFEIEVTGGVVKAREIKR